LLEYDEESGDTGEAGPPFVQIGNDGGLLSEPVETADRLELGSSQRADVVVDFSEYAGETLLLHNNPRRSIAGRAESGRTTPNPSRRSCLSTWQPRRASRSQRNSQTN